MDVHSEKIRRKNMQAIKSKNTKPEVLVRKALYKKGYRYRLHKKDLPGKPDIYLSKYKAAIWINGCFWHAHGCSMFKVPKSNTAFWVDKLNSNVLRDKTNLLESLKQNYRVLVIWECALKGKNKLSEELLIILIETWLQSDPVLGFIDTDGMTCHKKKDTVNLDGCVGQLTN
jgi:DNA mismatch endonuclease (patch repair protein)